MIFSCENILKLGLGASAMALFFGCAEPQPKAPPLPQYEPKALQPQGKGITVAKSTPYNCKILGEVEGKHNASGTRGATRELLRESAINDLKNEAGDTGWSRQTINAQYHKRGSSVFSRVYR